MCKVLRTREPFVHSSTSPHRKIPSLRILFADALQARVVHGREIQGNRPSKLWDAPPEMQQQHVRSDRVVPFLMREFWYLEAQAMHRKAKESHLRRSAQTGSNWHPLRRLTQR